MSSEYRREAGLVSSLGTMGQTAAINFSPLPGPDLHKGLNPIDFARFVRAGAKIDHVAPR